jgi:uncharacterized protein (DUF1501 family)
MKNKSRREFLCHAASLSTLGAVGAPLALNFAAIGNASAQSAADYKALVCVFLSGGNDAYNTVLATDTPSWDCYTSARNQAPDPIALKQVGTAKISSAATGSPDFLGGVLQLNPVTAVPGRSFALHPSLSRMSSMFNSSRNLAILANVGTLVKPTSKSDYTNVAFQKPKNLFSHNDQTSTWQALGAEGANSGWGGLMADQFIGSNGPAASFTSISVAGNAVWLAGKTAIQYQVSANGSIRMGIDSNKKIYGSTGVGDAMLAIVQKTRGNSLLQSDYASVSVRSIAADAQLSAVLPSARVAPYGTAGNGADPLLQYTNINGSLTTSNFTQQLQTVARMISAGRLAGLKRQVFFVTLGGFDNHGSQNTEHTDLMLRLDHGLAYFNNVTNSLGLQKNVTTFTASDFGRTFTSNGDGTDHGWGAHHFIMGGAVNGGTIAGKFPAFSQNDGKNNFSSPDQLNGTGAMIPTTSVEQYAATLGKWFGCDDSKLATIFPNLTNWSPSERSLPLFI